MYTKKCKGNHDVYRKVFALKAFLYTTSLALYTVLYTFKMYRET